MNSRLPVVCLAALIAAGHAGRTHATQWSNAVEQCQGALPNFEGSLRKRPLALANEGTSTAFVSCAMLVPSNSSRVRYVGLIVTNRAASSAVLSCTMIDGIAQPFPNNPPKYYPKSLQVAAGQFAVLSWSSEYDNANVLYRIPSVSCSLLPGMEINTILLTLSAA